MAGSMLSASDKLMTAASTGNTELVMQLLANSSSSSLEPDEVMHCTAVLLTSLFLAQNLCFLSWLELFVSLYRM